MKKTLIALLLVGSSSALFAQNTQNTTNNSNTNTTTNSTSNDVNASPSAAPTTDANSTAQPDANTNVNTDVNTNANNNANISTDASSNPNSMNQNNSVNSNSNMNANTDNNVMNNNAGMSNNTVSTGNYNAYGTLATDVPTTVRYSFQKEHPDVTGAQWYQTPTGQLRVMYKDANNQDMDLYYYGNSAQSYMISLPLRQSLTSDDIVAKAKSMFGLAVYDINRVKAANMEDVYHVRLLDNGQVKSVWINEQGTEVAATDVFRSTVVAESDVINEVNTAPASSDANSSNTNNNNSNSSNSSSSPAMNNSAAPSTNNSSSDTKMNTTNSSSTDNTTTVPAETNEVK
jgi:hypothetical protein